MGGVYSDKFVPPPKKKPPLFFLHLQASYYIFSKIASSSLVVVNMGKISIARFGGLCPVLRCDF